MAHDFDELPLYDTLTEKGDELHWKWRDSLSTFGQTLVGYLTQWGIFNPKFNTKQRKALQSPSEGQMFYNSDRKTIQIYLNGGWQEVTTTPAP